MESMSSNYSDSRYMPRQFLPSIDLRQYGLNLVLDQYISQDEFQGLLTKDILLNKVHTSEKGIIFSNSKKELEYSNPRKLGSGIYGAVTECTNADQCRQVAIKEVVFNSKLTSEVQIANFIKECIIQIILFETSRSAGNTSVPEIYRVGFSDESPSKGFIISELIENTLENFIKDKSEEEKDVIVTDAIVQVADILDFFQKTLQFNHRDLKSSNVMYKMVRGRPVYRIIDFGFSCLRWNQLQIQTELYKFRTCFKEGRDLAQLTYELRKYGKLSQRLRVWLYLLTKAPLMEWRSTYDYFNIPESPFSPDSFLFKTRPAQLSKNIKELPYYWPYNIPSSGSKPAKPSVVISDQGYSNEKSDNTPQIGMPGILGGYNKKQKTRKSSQLKRRDTRKVHIRKS